MSWSRIALVVLVLAVVALAIYLATRPSQTAQQIALQTGTGGTVSQGISQAGTAAVSLASSVAGLAGG